MDCDMKAAIRVENLGKCYRVAKNKQGGDSGMLRDLIVNAVKVPFRRMMNGGQSIATEDFWALKDVSFEVQPGEVVGIIGRNGAGKSTLLKILSRITKPTKGRIEINGRVGSLLEVGTGFHPELTGRENVYLNGSILGMSRKEIDQKFDEIVAFAEIDKFLDTPVKRYSSGMYVRLGFAVAAYLQPEILIVDEVLAVGDAAFQKKCIGLMGNVARSGRTVLFVSHNMAAVQCLCSRGVVLNQGQVVRKGNLQDCLSFYTGSGRTSSGQCWVRESNHPELPLGFAEIFCELTGKQPNLTLQTNLILRSKASHRPTFVALDVADASGSVILQSVPISTPFIPGWSGKSVTYEVKVVTHLPPLIPGEYSISAWCGNHYSDTVDMIDMALWFEVEQPPTENRLYPYSADHGRIAAVSTATCSIAT
jgi:lipopolysaccharide transport system ATP-binding protein